MSGSFRCRRALVLAATVFSSVLGAPSGSSAAPTGYVTMSDGTSIAVNIRMPRGYAEGSRYATILEMSGYDGGSAQGGTLMADYCSPHYRSCPLTGDSRSAFAHFGFEERYVTVHASIRGTGCSSGEFDLFSSRSALDGYELIQWISRRPWSNGKVGLFGHSYGGLTAFLIAATQPPALGAVSVSGLIDDLYRGIVYPGGVSNYGFPLVWTTGIRSLYDVGGGTAPGLVRPPATGNGSEIRAQCASNVAGHRRTVLNDAILQGVSDTDNDWWRARSLISYADRVRVPIHITGAYQDEQTGPRGPVNLWERVAVAEKRLLLTNGNHGTNTDPEQVWQDRRAWFDAHLLGEPGRAVALDYRPSETSVRTLFEMHDHAHHGETRGAHANARKDGSRYPYADTHWTDLYLQPGRSLGASPPSTDGSEQYLSGSARQSWSYQAGPRAGKDVTTPEGPDEVTFRSTVLDRPMTIAGPMTATLFVQSTAPETELFVSLIDEGPNAATGRTASTYVMRGMLRASHRAIDPHLSDCVDRKTNHRVVCTLDADDTVLYRPFRPHTNPTAIEPGHTYEYVVEIFPAGHIFRPGHRVVLKVHAPPAVDSYYAYVPRRPPAVNTILFGRQTPSRLTLPVVPLDRDIGAEIACGRQEAVRCVE